MTRPGVPAREATHRIRFLPYIGRVPEGHPDRGWGTCEEFYMSRADVIARYRVLRQERRIESAEIHEATGRDSSGRTTGARLLVEWRA